MGTGFGAAEFLGFLIFAAVWVGSFWKIYQKAGFPGWMAFLFLIPVVNLGAAVHLALAEWPGQNNAPAPEPFV
jgi:hypothetical protein